MTAGFHLASFLLILLPLQVQLYWILPLFPENQKTQSDASRYSLLVLKRRLLFVSPS